MCVSSGSGIVWLRSISSTAAAICGPRSRARLTGSLPPGSRLMWFMARSLRLSQDYRPAGTVCQHSQPLHCGRYTDGSLNGTAGSATNRCYAPLAFPECCPDGHRLAGAGAGDRRSARAPGAARATRTYPCTAPRAVSRKPPLRADRQRYANAVRGGHSAIGNCRSAAGDRNQTAAAPRDAGDGAEHGDDQPDHAPTAAGGITTAPPTADFRQGGDHGRTDQRGPAPDLRAWSNGPESG